MIMEFESWRHLYPTTFDAWLPWWLYDKLKIGPAVPILGTHPFKSVPVTVWHFRPKTEYPHSIEYILRKSICKNDI